MPEIGWMGEYIHEKYVAKYLDPAVKRFRNLIPEGLMLSTGELHGMQLLCAYETAFIGGSDFCTLFTEDEWAGFENSLDIICLSNFDVHSLN